MLGTSATAEVGGLKVTTVDNGTLPPEHYARRIADRILSISEYCPEPLRQQAEAFKNQILLSTEFYVRQAVMEERSYAAHLAEQHGHTDTAQAIRTR